MHFYFLSLEMSEAISCSDFMCCRFVYTDGTQSCNNVCVRVANKREKKKNLFVVTVGWFYLSASEACSIVFCQRPSPTVLLLSSAREIEGLLLIVRQ